MMGEALVGNKISLVMATCDRVKEVDKFLESVANQCFNLSLVEVIIVDQNNKPVLDAIVERYSAVLSIVHIRSNIKGLSYNRNLGLNIAVGDIVCFPDDDCEYYPNTLSTVVDVFSRYPIDVCLGRIYNRSLSRDILKKWPCNIISVTKFNFFRLASSITIFSKKTSCRFDEELGVGAKFGAGEDSDYLWRLLRNGAKIMYFPSVEVSHPDQLVVELSVGKVKNYTCGFGALLRKNWSFSAFIILVKAIGFYFYKSLFHLLKGELKNCRLRLNMVGFLFVGFFGVGG